MKAAVVLLLLISAAQAFAVSQVGGGKLKNPAEGFETVQPSEFVAYQIFEDDSVRFSRPSLGPVDRFRPQLLMSYLLRVEYPELAEADRAFFAEHFLSRGWSTLELSNSCIVGFSKQSSNYETRVFSWGPGRGLVLAAPLNEIGMRGLNEMTFGLQLDEGACQW